MATRPPHVAPSLRSFVSATITTAADGLSEAVDLGGLILGAIKMSTAWTDASMTFLGSFDSSANLQNLYTSTGGELTHLTTALRLNTFDPFPFAGLRYIQLRSGTSATPVAQAAARTIGLSLIPYGPIK